MSHRGIPNPEILIKTTIPPIIEGNFFEIEPIFSFKFFDHKHKDFDVSKISRKELKNLFYHLSDICTKKWNEIIQSGQYHYHEVNWQETAYTAGFRHLPTNIKEHVTSRQFKAFGHFRIFGFFDRSIFHVVWFDNDHKVYPQK